MKDVVDYGKQDAANKRVGWDHEQRTGEVDRKEDCKDEERFRFEQPVQVLGELVDVSLEIDNVVQNKAKNDYKQVDRYYPHQHRPQDFPGPLSGFGGRQTLIQLQVDRSINLHLHHRFSLCKTIDRS